MPIAGTDALAAAIGAESTPLGSGLPLITRYLEGSHGNPISAGQKGADTFSSRAVFDEMVFQMLTLFSADDPETASVTVNNACVVKDAPKPADCSGSTDAGDGSDGGSGGGSDEDGPVLDVLPF